MYIYICKEIHINIHTTVCIYIYTHINVASHCNTLQHTATHCNTLQHTSPYAVRVAATVELWSAHKQLYVCLRKNKCVYVSTCACICLHRATHARWSTHILLCV